MKKRNINLDVIRSIAVLFVISIHFLLHSEFYKYPIVSKKMMGMLALRIFFACCVPLFVLLTGYLMSKKELSKKYYKGIIKVIGLYLIISIECILLKKYYFHIPYTKSTALLALFDFSGDSYSWYVKMYIGIFCLIPFLNMIVKNTNEKQHKILLLTLFFICIVPTVLNVYDLTSIYTFINSKVNNVHNAIFDDYWLVLWPFLYYFTGAYIRKYKPKIPQKKVVTALLITFLFFSYYNIKRNYGLVYVDELYMQYFGLPSFLCATLIFIGILNINMQKISKSISKIITFISDHVFGIYLASNMVDMVVYPIFREKILDVNQRIIYFIPIVLFIFVVSTFISYISNLIYKLILWIIPIFINKGKKLYEKAKKFILTLNKKIKIHYILFGILIIIGFIFNLWRIKYGSGSSDEAFYLTIPYRLCFGDSLLTNEWHMSQFVGFILYPIMKVYTSFLSTESIMFNFRFLYIFFKLLITIVLFIQIVKKDKLGAFLVSTIFMLYTPYNISQFSYNSLGIIFTLLFSLLYFKDSNSKLIKLISGIMYSLAVLCSPYLIFIFIGLFFINIIKYVKTRNKNIIVNFLIYSLGAFIVFSIFVIFIFSRTSLTKIINCIPLILSDPEHQTGNELKTIILFIKVFISYFHHISYVFVCTIIMIILDYIINKKVIYKNIYFLIICSASIVQLTEMNNSVVANFNFLTIPLSIVGIVCILIIELSNIKDKKYIYYRNIYIVSQCYAILIAISSNQLIFAYSNGIFVGTLMSVLIIRYYIKIQDKKINKYILSTVVLCLFITQIFTQIKSDINYFYPIGERYKLTKKINYGPYKNIIVSQAEYEKMDRITRDLKVIKNNVKGNVIYYNSYPYFYLYLEMPMSVYSGWSGKIDYQIKSEREYLKINPSKKPKYVYVDYDNYDEVLSEYPNYEVTKLDNGYLLTLKEE